MSVNARRVAVLVCLGCCLAAIVATGSAAASGAEIEVENGISQSEAEDVVDVETRVSVPEAVVEFELELPAAAEVYELDGFERSGDGTYEWTGTAAEPSLRYEFDGAVGETHGDHDGPSFVVADEWALVRTPSTGASWRSTEDVAFVRGNVADGQGVASTRMAYLGPYTEHTDRAGGQTFRLIVPEAAELAERPAAILDALRAAEARLAIGERSPGLFAVAAPTAGHEWGPAGLAAGDGDMWVRDDQRLGTARDTWVHEYVHTRQNYRPTPATRWTIEGMADYYTALLAYERGGIGYDGFRDRLEAGTDPAYGDVRLADPGTWSGTRADYERGALVVAHLDRRLRAEADSSLDAVIAGFNEPDRELTRAAFLDAIEAAGGSDIRGDAERYTETTDAPPIASRSEHVNAFGGADVRYAVGGVAVSGPYRTGPIEEPVFVAGETLEVDVSVRNVGADAGPFAVELRGEDGVVASETGDLTAGGSTTLRFEHGFDTHGGFELVSGTERTPMVVEESADIRVISAAAEPSGVEPGDPVTLRATVASTANRPGVGEVAFVVDGETVATESVGTADTADIETVVEFDADAEYAVVAGGQSTAVDVERAGLPGVPGLDDQPGFGPAVAVVALIVAAVVARRR